MPATTRGSFILFEGMDRVGKTTQVTSLIEHLTALGHTVKRYRFPDRQNESGVMIDGYLKNAKDLDDRMVHLLFSANRHEAATEIRETLMSGTTIVCDRYCFSGAAYTMAKQAECNAEAGSSAMPKLDYEWCIVQDEGLPAPDLVVLLDMDPNKAAERGAYGEERYEKVEFQTEIRNAFGYIRKRCSGIEWQKVDAAREPEVVAKDIASAVDQAAAKLSPDVQVLTRDSFGIRFMNE